MYIEVTRYKVQGTRKAQGTRYKEDPRAKDKGGKDKKICPVRGNGLVEK